MSFYKMHQRKICSSDLETWFKLTGVFPDVLMVHRTVLFAPVSYLENPPDRHLGTPADAGKTPDWESEQFGSLPLCYCVESVMFQAGFRSARYPGMMYGEL